MPTAEQEVNDVRAGHILNDNNCLHLKALRDFTDVHGKQRKAGQEWIIDRSMADVHIIDAWE